MGIEGLKNFQSDPNEDPSQQTSKPQPTDQEVEDRHQTELQQQRDEHNERLGRPTSPGYTPAHDTTPPTAQPEESATFDLDADPDAGEEVADYDAEESNKKE